MWHVVIVILLGIIYIHTSYVRIINIIQHFAYGVSLAPRSKQLLEFANYLQYVPIKHPERDIGGLWQHSQDNREIFVTRFYRRKIKFMHNTYIHFSMTPAWQATSSRWVDVRKTPERNDTPLK